MIARPTRHFRILVLLLSTLLALLMAVCSSDQAGEDENCANRYDDDGDGVVDCLDSDCRDNEICQSNAEACFDGLDNDLDGDVDCVDSDCPACVEDCGNQVDDNDDERVDCDDPECKGIDPRCGEVCGDGMDNDDDGKTDCNDEDCFDVIPPCGGGVGPDGTICAYGEDEPHICECADGVDNDGDDEVDGADLHCFGPFDDDEETYATGIPGDNKGSKGDKECPFDGNSGTGNDGVCCNLDNPGENITPNGCDNYGCCEIDVNGNLTGEHVYVREDCVFAVDCGQDGTHGCSCASDGDCDNGQYCVPDDDSGAGFCSTCEPCEVNEECDNTCECGEQCFGGFTQPDSECEETPGTCPQGVTACPGGDGDCDTQANQRCTSGCCYAQCPTGVIPCDSFADCPTDIPHYCITGCCVEVPN